MAGGPGFAGLVLFEDCSADEVRRLAAVSHLRNVPTGRVIIDVGEVADQLSFVTQGAVDLDDGAGFEGSLGRGDMFGELSVLTGRPSSVRVTAHEATQLLTVDVAYLPTLLAMPTVGPRLRAIAEARIAAGGTRVVTAASVPVILRAPRMRAQGAGLHPRSERHPVRSLALAVVALIAAGATIFVVTQRNRSTVVALDDVLAQFATAPTSAPTGQPQVAGPQATPVPLGTPGSEPAVASPDATSPGSPTQPTAIATVVPDVTTVPGGTTVTPTAPSGYSPPPTGVYTYASTGGESISIAGASHRYPPETYAVVRSTGGCGWSVEHRVLEEHVDRREVCSATERIEMTTFGTTITFFGQSDGLDYVCDPGVVMLTAAAPGTVSSGVCPTEDGRGSAAYETTFLGSEDVVVGGANVATQRLRMEFTLDGDARGTSSLQLWLEPRTGLWVRIERKVDTLAKSVWGDVRYQEDATFQLLSMLPRT